MDTVTGTVTGTVQEANAGQIFFKLLPSRTEGIIEGVPYIDVPAQLFSTGTHKGTEYTTQQFDAWVSHFNISQAPSSESDWKVPVQLDHSHSARSTIGNVRKLWREDNELWGVLRFIGAEAVQNVKTRVWSRLSIGHDKQGLVETSVTPFPYLDTAQTYKKEAAPMPQVTTPTTHGEFAKKQDAADAEKAEDKKGGGKDEGAEMKAACPAKEMSDEEMAAGAKPTGKEYKKEAATVDYSNLPEIQAMRAEIQALKASQEQARAEFAKAQAQAEEERAAVLRYAKAKETVTEFSIKGLTTPAMLSHEVELLKTFSDEQITLYTNLKLASPEVVEFGMRSHPDISRPGGPDMTQIKNDAAALAKKYNSLDTVTL